MMNIYASKATVQASEGMAILDHTYEPTQAKVKQDYIANQYDGAVVRQKMALGVAWHSHSTQAIRSDYKLRDRYMADIVQACMEAAYEPYTSKDTDRVWFRCARDENGLVIMGADGHAVKEIRKEIANLTSAELECRFIYAHIERKCRAQVKYLLDLRMHECLVKARNDEEPEASFEDFEAMMQANHGADVTEEQFDRITAKRVYDEYLQGDGSEWDKLDAMLNYMGKYLNGKQMRQLEGLIKGTVKLSDISSTTRTVLRTVVLGTLHMEG